MIVNLQLMMAENERAMTEVQQQNWLMTGQAELSNVMRGEPHVAALYVLQPNNQEQRLKLMGSYALTERVEGIDGGIRSGSVRDVSGASRCQLSADGYNDARHGWV